MAHAFLVVNCPPPQHEALVKAMNERAYDFNKKRAGYNIPAVSEVRMYDVRIKKEVLPFFLKDLNAHNVLDESFVEWALPLSNEHKQGVKQPIKKLFLKTAIKIVRFVFSRLNIFPPQHAVKGEGKPFVTGWHYTYCVGTMNDPDRGDGEEL